VGSKTTLTFRHEYSNFDKSKQGNFDAKSSQEVLMFFIGPLGLPEILMIMVIIVIIFGARRLPELGKSLGEGIKNFRKSITSKEKENTSPPEEPPPPEKEE
jgi:sec-independent protein translocase protein TatA